VYTQQRRGQRITITFYLASRSLEQLMNYIGVDDVTGSKLAFNLKGRQVRTLAIEPRRRDKIGQIELDKGLDQTAPIFMAVD
jgi:hypothetical protein